MNVPAVRARAALCLLLLPAAAAASQGGADPARRPFSVEDLLAVKQVADPQVSPDGRWILHAVAEVDPEADRWVTRLWLAAADGSAVRPLTGKPEGESGGRWSPDGRWIAYVADREGSGPQIWKVPPGGGEEVQVTSISTGVSGLVWSPRGDRIAFTSRVWPDLEGDEAQRARARERKASGIQARVIDDLLYRHWDHWRDGKRSHVFVVPAGGGEAADATPGDRDCPPLLHGGPHCYAFSPDGRFLAYTRGPEASVEAVSTAADLMLLDLETGQRRDLTEGQGGWNGAPVWTPDGRAILHRRQERDGYESDRMGLVLLELAAGERTRLLGEMDRSFDEVLMHPDGSHFAVVVQDEGTRAVWSASLDGSEVRRRQHGRNVRALSASADGSVVAGLVDSLVAPAEVFLVSMKGDNAVRQLTRHNEDLLARVEMPSRRSLHYRGAGGARIQAWVVEPPPRHRANPPPMVLWIHGGPQGAWLDTFHPRWNAALHAAAGYVIFCPNFHGSTGFGHAFTEQISRDWGGACMEDLMLGVDHMVEHEGMDPDRIAAAGASFGGYMVNLLLGHTDRFQAMVSHAGVFNLESFYGATEELWFPEWDLGGPFWSHPEDYDRFSPHRFAAWFRTPTLVVHGELDFRVPVGEAFQLFTALRRQGVPARLLHFPDEGHWIRKPRNSRLWNETVLEWLDRHLEGKGTDARTSNGGPR